MIHQDSMSYSMSEITRFTATLWETKLISFGFVFMPECAWFYRKTVQENKFWLPWIKRPSREWQIWSRRPSSDDSLNSPTVIPPSALDKPSIMKRYQRRRTTRWGVTARLPTMVTQHDTGFVECRWWNDGWTVKTVVTWRSSASTIPAPGLDSRFRSGSVSRSSHTVLPPQTRNASSPRLPFNYDLKIGNPVVTLPDAWRYRVSVGTDWPGIRIMLWLSETDSLSCGLYLSVAARAFVWADPSQKYTRGLVAGTLHNQPTATVESRSMTWKVAAVCLFVGCLSSQQHASVSQGRICTDNFTCCHTEIEAADQTFHLTQSQYTDTGPTSPSADPKTPGAWQGSHWSANF